jgi:hypothetical protein
VVPIKILVVDNEEDQRRLMSLILSRFGFDGIIRKPISMNSLKKTIESAAV